MHKWKGFSWSEECDKAFEDLKAYLAHSSVFSRSEKEEILYAYIAVVQHAVSLVSIQVDKGIQKPVYYVSKSLQEVEVKYLPLKKAILAIIHATKELPHYFLGHTVVILTQFPLQALLWRFDYTRRVAKWGTMLGAFDIKYLPRTVMKRQILANLVAEFTEELDLGDPEEVRVPKEAMRISSITTQ